MNGQTEPLKRPEIHNQATFVNHTSCSNCGSSDGAGVYDDGHVWCFVCSTYSESDGEAGQTTGVSPAGPTKQKDLLEGEAKALGSRRLSQLTCAKYGYLIGTYQGEPVQIATYRDNSGLPVAQKLRFQGKKFQIVGDAKAMTLFGSHIWSTGKKIVVTEGEIDCLSVAQAGNLRWPVVSLPNGAQSAVKAIKANWEYLNQFEEVILMFDQDQVGQAAAQAVAELLPVGKAKIASLPCKDANECLMQGKQDAIIEAIFQAREFRPDGIVTATDYRDIVSQDEEASSIEYPYSLLNEITRGLRKGEMVTLTAGSGVGKTTLVRELAHHLHSNHHPVGMMMLEEANKRTLLGLVGIEMSQNITIDRSNVTDEEITEAFDQLFSGDRPPLYLFDGWGSNDVDLICNRIAYMAKALGVEWVILDHISILVSGQAFGGNERTLIDATMTKLRTLVQELNIGLIIVSHLRRPDGNQGHEDGAAVRLGQLRGSHAIAQLSDICIALQVDADEPDGDIRHLHILKNRFTGETGPAGVLAYDRDTGRLLEHELVLLNQPEDDSEGETIDAERTSE